MSKNKDEKALVGRVKKAVKKSRRKLGEEKFEKELQRTIVFLSELQRRLKQVHAQPVRSKPAGNGAAKSVPKAAAAKPAKRKASKTQPASIAAAKPARKTASAKRK
jgi:hypothetical protein